MIFLVKIISITYYVKKCSCLLNSHYEHDFLFWYALCFFTPELKKNNNCTISFFLPSITNKKELPYMVIITNFTLNSHYDVLQENHLQCHTIMMMILVPLSLIMVPD